MAFRDGKKSRDEREKARREERRKALSERLGGRPDQPGRSDAEREETKRRRETPKPAAKKPASADADAAPKAEKPKTPEPAKPAGKRPAERKPKRRFWQRGARPKPVAKPPRRRPEPEKPKADEQKTRRLRPEKPKADKPKAEDAKTRSLRPQKPRAETPKSEKPKAEKGRPEKAKSGDGPRSRSRTRGDGRRKPAPAKRRGPSRQDRVKALRARGGSAAKSGGKALREGAAATRRRAKAAQPKVAAAGRKSWELAAPLLAIPFLALAFSERWIRTGLRIGGQALSTAVAFLDRHVTPTRVVVLVTVVAAVCLIVAQFQDYRGVEVGQPGYAGLERTVTAQQVDFETPRDAHGPWLLILGGLAIGAAVGALVTRRRALGLVVSAIGVAGLLVSVIGDRSEGLNESQTAVAYSGTNAVLLDGFYAQVAACGVLIAAGLLVALYAGAPVRSRAKSPRRAQRRKPRPRPPRPATESGTVAEGGA